MNLGLRAKSALALGACVAVVLALALVAGWPALRAIEDNLGTAYARNVTQYNKQRILGPVLRELALSQRLADSEVTRRWLKDEGNADKKALFFAEAEGYRRAFADHSYFLISRATRHYYFNDKHSKWSAAPRYSLKPNDPNDAWFFNTMRQKQPFNINVDPDTKLKVLKVWFNVLVKDGGRNIGLAGTGLDLTQFLQSFINSREAGVTPMILNRAGAIQAHPDPQLIDYSSINNKGTRHSTVFRLLAQEADRARLQAALRNAEQHSDQIQVFWADLDGRRQLFALSFIPELGWHVLTAVDLRAAQVVDSDLWLPPLLLGLALLAVLLTGIVVAVNRLILTPMLHLTKAAGAVGAGHYDVALPPAGNDELGELTRAFGVMAAQVRTHTAELETRVRERTQELLSVNEQMVAANKQIGDSIQYAGLIQSAILPNREMARALGDNYFVLWRPC